MKNISEFDIDIGNKAFENGEYIQALDFLLPCAEKNNAEAQATVGMIFFLGLVGDRDLEKAIFWLEKAAKNDRGDAAHNLSTLYVTCEPEMPRDVDKSKKWLQRARELKFEVAPNEWYESILNDKSTQKTDES